MEKLYITSLQNPLVKAWRALKDAKARAEQGLFLAEGDHLTGEALTAHAAVGRLDADGAGDGGGLADGAAGVRAQGERRLVGADGGGRAAG